MEPKYSTDFSKLVCGHEIAQKLVALGVKPAAALHWWDEAEDDITIDTDEKGDKVAEKWRCGQLFLPGDDSVPAWTLEELRIMIGWHFVAADLREPRPKPMPNEETTFYVYYPEVSKTYKSGAEGTAHLLHYLLTGGQLTVEEVNNRYTEKFKPE